MIPFITKYDVYKTWDFLVETTAAKQNVKSVSLEFPTHDRLERHTEKAHPKSSKSQTKKNTWGTTENEKLEGPKCWFWLAKR